MDNDQARKLVALHENADRALLNLRNANGMATDDPRAPELLSEAGDAYAEAIRALWAEQSQIVEGPGESTDQGELDPESPSEAPSAAQPPADASTEAETPTQS